MKINLIVFAAFIGLLFHFGGISKEAEAQVTGFPFAGQIAEIEFCCNGIRFSTTGQYRSPIYGTFIMPWTNMIPNPDLGLGLYSQWALLPSEKVVGTAIPTGVCLSIASECTASIPVLFTVKQVGTTLLTI